MTEPSLPDKVVALDQTLGAASIGHAFGGALALAYYAEPRTTVDVDINVFVPPADATAVAEILAPIGVKAPDNPDIAERDGQWRLWWGRTPVDLFFSYDPVHEAMQQSARTVPFGSDTIQILAPEHLVVCKVVFDRPKDWLDLEQILVCQTDLDLEEVRRWLDPIIGGEDHRNVRFNELASELLGA